MKVMLLAVLLTGAALPAFAEENEQWKQDIEAKIEALTKELERRDIGEASDEPVYIGTKGFAPAASKIYHVKRGVSIGGYGEMVYQNFDSDRDNGTASGRKDELDFLRAIVYIGHKFTDKILFNSEIEFEHASTSGGSAARGEVSVEFAYLDFALHPAFGLRAGLLLVPVGIANELHEPTAFHGARRPNVENDIIPTSWRENGAGIFGEAGPIEYRVYLLAGLQGVRDNAAGTGVTGFSAGSALRGGRSKGAKSIVEDFAAVGRLDFKGIPGSVIGVSGYRGGAGQDASQTGEEIDAMVNLWDVHGSFEFRGAELKALYAKGRVSDVALLNAANALAGSSSIGEEFFGGYVEVAYDLLPLFKSRQYLAPFVRWERIDTQQSVPTDFSKNPANDRVEYTYGLTYKPHPNTVIKADFQDMDNKAGTGVDRINLGLGYYF